MSRTIELPLGFPALGVSVSGRRLCAWGEETLLCVTLQSFDEVPSVDASSVRTIAVEGLGSLWTLHDAMCVVDDRGVVCAVGDSVLWTLPAEADVVRASRGYTMDGAGRLTRVGDGAVVARDVLTFDEGFIACWIDGGARVWCESPDRAGAWMVEGVEGALFLDVDVGRACAAGPDFVRCWQLHPRATESSLHSYVSRPLDTHLPTPP